jgi:hypothetical protein
MESDDGFVYTRKKSAPAPDHPTKKARAATGPFDLHSSSADHAPTSAAAAADSSGTCPPVEGAGQSEQTSKHTKQRASLSRGRSERRSFYGGAAESTECPVASPASGDRTQAVDASPNVDSERLAMLPPPTLCAQIPDELSPLERLQRLFSSAMNYSVQVVGGLAPSEDERVLGTTLESMLGMCSVWQPEITHSAGVLTDLARSIELDALTALEASIDPSTLLQSPLNASNQLTHTRYSAHEAQLRAELGAWAQVKQDRQNECAALASKAAHTPPAQSCLAGQMQELLAAYGAASKSAASSSTALLEGTFLQASGASPRSADGVTLICWRGTACIC